jgi:hypothetical protein
MTARVFDADQIIDRERCGAGLLSVGQGTTDKGRDRASG